MLLRTATCLLLTTPLLTAQTGPWADGELLVRSVGPEPGSQVQTIYRIDPETGDGEPLIDGFYYLGGPGGMAFDGYRGRLLLNAGVPPAIFSPLFLLIDADGSFQPLTALEGERVRALAPVGDGRVYLQRSSDNPTNTIEYLDPSGALHTLLDETGLAPLSLAVEHLYYHDASNALIGTTSASYTPGGCVAFESSVYRIPLVADGSAAAAPVACASILAGLPNHVLSLDSLPGGDVLLLMAGSQFFNETLRRVDPLALTTETFASPSVADVDGAVWSARIERAVLLDDVSNVLRTYEEYDVGGGEILVTDVVVSGQTTGFSPVESIAEVTLFGSSCAGGSFAYGQGLAGSGGIVPSLSATSCPDAGKPFAVRVDDVLGGAPGILLAGLSQVSLPAVGGTLHVFPFQQVIPALADGTPGVAGDGGYDLGLLFTGPSFVGLDVYLQAVFADPGASFGYALSPGLRLAVG